jgi:hypothetical protein
VPPGESPYSYICQDLEEAVASMKACLNLHCVSLGSLLGDKSFSNLIHLVSDVSDDLEADWNELSHVSSELLHQEREQEKEKEQDKREEREQDEREEREQDERERQQEERRAA